MALRTINFEVGVDGALSPATPQDGGVQGDHNVTEVKFKLCDALHKHLQDVGASGKLVYRFRGVDGEGKEILSDTAVLTEPEVVYPLEHSLTKHGGLVKVELIITHIEEVSGNDGSITYNTNEVVHTKPASLKLIFTSYASGAQEMYQDIAALTEIIKQKHNEALEALDEIRTAKAELEVLCGDLNSVNEFIFQGGDASNVLSTEFVIDDVMSDYSRNAVENKVAKAYVDTTVAEEVESQIKENSHPIGSIFVTSTENNPNNIGFDGTWELIDKDLATKSGSLNIDESNRENNGIFTYSDLTISGTALNYYCEGHFLSMSFKLKAKIDLNESNHESLEIPIGDLTLEYFGISSFSENAGNRRFYFTGYSDSEKAIVMLYIDLHKGKVYIADILSADGNTIGKDKDITFTFNLSIPGDKTLSSKCDKFYWKRTA